MAIVAGSALVWWALGALVYGALAALLLALSLADFYFPVSYTLTEQGARESCLWPRRFIRWDEVKQVFADEVGLKLSPVSYTHLTLPTIYSV